MWEICENAKNLFIEKYIEYFYSIQEKNTHNRKDFHWILKFTVKSLAYHLHTQSIADHCSLFRLIFAFSTETSSTVKNPTFSKSSSILFENLKKKWKNINSFDSDSNSGLTNNCNMCFIKFWKRKMRGKSEMFVRYNSIEIGTSIGEQYGNRLNLNVIRSLMILSI